MPTYGLRVINDDSELLIDSELVNPTFVQKLEFNTTPTFTEAGPTYSQTHPGYIRRDYTTDIFSVASGGSYIVLWALPDTMSPGQPDKDIWYHFPTSTIALLNKALTCSVYANSQGSPITYSLPTAYIFAVNAAAVNAMTTTGPALRMYNSSQLKTFDSTLTQLVPYSITDSFNIPGADTTTNLYLPVPTNPVYLLPKSAVLFAGDTGNGYSSEKVFDTTYRRRGSYVDSRTISTSYSDNNPIINSGFATFFAGNVGNLSIIAADADFYQSPGSGSGGGANPTYSLSSNYSAVNEGTIITITLTTTLVTDGTNVPWTVTGIDAADLVSGGLTGNFVVQSNTATTSFTIKNDTTTEGTETFKLTLTGLSTEVNVTINDTSIGAVAYSFSDPGAINEGGNYSVTFTATNASGKIVSFSLVGNTASIPADVSTNTANWTVPSNAASSTTVALTTYNDLIAEGAENFRVAASIDGSIVAYSPYITINDTSTSSIAIASSLTEISTNNLVTINVANGNGSSVYLTTSNSVVSVQSPYAASWTINSNNYSNTTYLQTTDVTADTSVTIYLRKDSTTGPILAQTTVTVTNAAFAYSWATPSAINEGSTGSLTFNYSGAANRTITFSKIAPTSGLDGSGSTDVTLNTTSYAVGNTNASGTVSVGYSTSADVATEGTEYFRLRATVDGTNYDSSNITINDTSLSITYDITVASSWGEGTTNNAVTISASNANVGTTLYLTSSNTALASTQSPYASSWTVDSAAYSATTYYTTSFTTGDSSVTLYLRVGSTTGPIVAQKSITITNAISSYSWATTPLTVSEGATSSLDFNYSNAAGVSFTFSIVSPTGGVADGSGSADITLNTTSYTVGSTNAADKVIVGYSVSADQTTETTEYFRLAAYINGTYYYSNNITISDTSTTPVPVYSITPVGTTWNENTTQSSTVSVQNAMGTTLALVANSSIVTSQTATIYINSNNYTTTIYWTVGATLNDFSANIALKVNGTGTTGGYDGAIVSYAGVTIKDIPAAGTAIGSPYCLAYGSSPYTLRQVRANGTGGTYNDDTNNSTTCGYVAPTYTLSVTSTSVNEGSNFTISLATNQSGSYGYTITGITSADIGGTSLTGTLANGETRVINVSADTATEGTEYFVVSLDNGQSSKTVTINDTSTASLVITQGGSTYGTVGTAFSGNFTLTVNGSSSLATWSSSGTLPPGLSLSPSGGSAGSGYTVYGLSGTPTTTGTYTFSIIATPSSGGSTSKSVTLPIYAAAGTNSGSQYCGTGANQYTLYQDKNNGSGGTYQTTVATNSASCGYVAPSYSLGNTFTSLANGSSGSFYVQSNNANGVTLTPSLSGTGASRVSISPTSSTISGNGTVNTFFTITSTLPTTSIGAQSVTVSVAGTSFTFTVQAYTVTAAAPTVTGISLGGPGLVDSGNNSWAIISFSGGITSTTYLQVEYNLGYYAVYYGTPVNNYAGGYNVADDAQFLLGATNGIVYTPVNPGESATIVRLRARSVDAFGTALTAWTGYVNFTYGATSGAM